MTDGSDGRILGTTEISQRWRISLIKAVREEFEADGDAVAEGDRLVYRVRDGHIVIETA